MTKITFYKGLRVIGGTFVSVETDRAVCMFDFGFTVSDRADESIRLRPDHIPQDYVRPTASMNPRRPPTWDWCLTARQKSPISS